MIDPDRLKYDAITRELERMRAMQYSYHRKFFALLLVSTLVAGLGLMFPSGFSLTFVCFGLVTTGVTAAFLLHFCDFARTHARALEAKLNELLGERLLIAAELESDYFYPHEEPHLGAALEWPKRFFVFYTLHFCGVWALFVVFAGWQLSQGLSTGPFLLLTSVWLVWTTLNLLFVYGWFRGEAVRKMAQRLRETYAAKV